MQRAGARWSLLLALATLAACSETPRTQVMVFVRAEEGVRARAQRLDVEVFGAGPGEARALRDTLTYTDAASSEFLPLQWPRRVALVPAGGDPLRTFAVVATAQDDGGEIFARAEVASSYLEGQTLTLDVWLRDDCVGTVCPAGETCAAGACRPVDATDPCSLRTLEGDAVPEGCAPTTDAGHDADVDAGTPDAGPLDAGPDDAGPPDAGPTPVDRYNVVFVTSTPRAPGGLGGIEGAHRYCQDLARDANLPEPASYRAFLSTSSAPAISLLTGSRGFVRVDGRPVADRPSELVAGEMRYPIALDETGAEPLETRVATGTRVDHTAGLTCDDWTSEAGEPTAGNAFDGVRFWLDRRFGFAPAPRALSCGEPLSLYCFGTGRTRALEPAAPPAGAGGAFVTSEPVGTQPAGIAAFDDACQREGGEDYVAFLPDGAGASPIARLGGFGGPWYRPDGVRVAAGVAELAGEQLDAPPIQTALGVYAADGRIWSAEATPDVSTGFACDAWTSTGPRGRFSYLGLARTFYTRAVYRECGGAEGERVLCLSTAPVY